MVINLGENGVGCMLTDDSVYACYQCVRQHFTTDRYNIFEDGVDMSIKISDPHEKDLFGSIAHSFENKHTNELFFYFVSDIVYNRKDHVLTEDKAFKSYMTWNYRKNNIIRIFNDDLSVILENIQRAPYKKPHWLFCGVNGAIPFVFTLLDEGKIAIESVKILADITEVMEEWKGNVHLVDWIDLIRILDKLDGFIKYDFDSAWMKWTQFRNVLDEIKQV